MDSMRVFAALILAVSSFLLVEAWMSEHGNDRPEVTNQGLATITDQTEEDDIPKVTVPLEPEALEEESVLPQLSVNSQDKGKKITVKTDVLLVTFNTIGPEIERVELLDHPSKQKKNENFVIFEKTANRFYTAQIGLIGKDLPNHKNSFSTEHSEYLLVDGEDEIQVRFKDEKDGVTVFHVYRFQRNSYVIDITTEIINRRSEALQAHAYYQLVRDDSNPTGTSKMLPTYTGAAVFTEESKYRKVDFSDIEKGSIKYPQKAKDGWIAIIQHYFLGAWLPTNGDSREYFTKMSKSGLFSVGVILPVPVVEVLSQAKVNNRLYVGPQDQDNLSKLSNGLNLTVDYGWLHIIAAPLFKLLKWINSYVGNWGWSIVVLTILIKLLFYPLSAASYRSMARMRVVAPKLQKLKELYGDDKQRMQQEMMSLYKTEQINPLGGCLPILVQIPVFISLYWVLLASVELRYAPFMLWIDDLSAKDPFYVLPLLMGLSMIIQTRLNPTPPDPVQAKIMKIMPIIFSVFFFFFPSGLVLYWLANNILSIAQQWRITSVIEGKTNLNVSK